MPSVPPKAATQASSQVLGTATRVSAPASSVNALKPVQDLSLVSLPKTTVLNPILEYLYAPFTSNNVAEARSAFKTRLAVEGSCRFLRELSMDHPWLTSIEDGQILSFYEQMKLVLPENADVVSAVKILFVNCPERLCEMEDLFFDDLPQAVASRLLEEVLKAKQSADRTEVPGVHSLAIRGDKKVFEVLKSGLFVHHMYLRFDFGLNPMTTKQLTKTISACGSDLCSFSLIVSGSLERQDVEPVIKAVFKGLRGCDDLEDLQLRQLDVPCSDMTRLPIEDLAAALGTKVKNFKIDDIRVTASKTGSIAPFTHLVNLDIVFTSCFCPQPADNIFVSPSFLDTTAEPLFPNLESLTVLGPADIKLSQVRQHCPRIKKLQFGFFMRGIETGMLRHSDRDLEQMIRRRGGTLQELVIYVMPCAPVRNDPLGWMPTPDPQIYARYEVFLLSISQFNAGLPGSWETRLLTRSALLERESGTEPPELVTMATRVSPRKANKTWTSSQDKDEVERTTRRHELCSEYPRFNSILKSYTLRAALPITSIVY